MNRMSQLPLARFRASPARWLAALFACSMVVAMTPAAAKLPPPTEEQKAKAAEAAEKAAANARKDAELLGQAQDRVAQQYGARLKAQGKPFNPTYTPPPPAAVPAATAGAPLPAGTAASSVKTPTAVPVTPAAKPAQK